jgi:general secretion pathway protein C
MKTLALILLSSTALADTSVAEAPSPAPRGVAACYRDEALSRAIRCKGKRCTIDRTAVDCWLSNTQDLAMSARIVPAFHDGANTGFKLFAVKPGSIFSHLMIQNGDELRTINGIDLSSPEKALEVYVRLRAADSFEVALVRKSAPLKLRYDLIGTETR